MKVLFIHGFESGPNGRKVHLLREAGYEVYAPDLRYLIQCPLIGFKLISIRPVFNVIFTPSMPVNEDKFETAGSAKTVFANRCCSADIAVKEIFCGPSAIA